MSKVEVEVYALSEMNTALLKLSDTVKSAIEQTRRAIELETTRLQKIEQQRNQNLVRCQSAYERCRSYRDRNGYPPPCFSELRAMQMAQNELEEIKRQIKLFSDQADNYSYQAASFQEKMDANVNEARAYLEDHISASLQYLRGHPNEVGTISGGGTHGSRYQQARSEWFRRGASNRLRGEGRDLQGWMRQEVNRGRNYRSPRYYDTGHFVAGVDIPENFRWELSCDNRRRPHVARRYNLPSTYY